MNPQEKKRLSLERDCRNTYGENDKSSRKAIRKRKKWVNQSYRRETNQVLSHIDMDTDNLTTEVSEVQRKHWKKDPDTPLGEKLLRDANYRLKGDIEKRASEDSGFLEQFCFRLNICELPTIEVRIIMRRARAITLDWNSSSLELSASAVKVVSRILDEDNKEKDHAPE